MLDRIAPKHGHKIIRVADGFLMRIDLSDFVQRTIYLTGSYEPHVCAELRQWLRPGSVFVDCGANVGYISLYAAQIVGPNGRVFSFEPNPPTFDELLRNVDINSAHNIRAIQIGLSDTPGTGTFYPDETGNSGASTLRRGNGLSITITLDTYDRLAEVEAIPPPDVLKIDVEGAEELAFRGMHQLLSGTKKPIIISEISEWSLSLLGSSRAAIVSLLRGYGYQRPQVLPPIRVNSDPDDPDLNFQFDVVFLPR